MLCLLAAASASAEEPTAAEVPVLGVEGVLRALRRRLRASRNRKSIFNGGDPSGEVSEIHWQQLGRPDRDRLRAQPDLPAAAAATTASSARVELRATELGKCAEQVAYTRLEIRAPKHPGGKLGQWLLWSGAKTICEAPR